MNQKKIRSLHTLNWETGQLTQTTPHTERTPTKNSLIDSSNIIYTTPEEHKCQMTNIKRTVPTQNEKKKTLNI